MFRQRLGFCPGCGAHHLLQTPGSPATCCSTHCLLFLLTTFISGLSVAEFFVLTSCFLIFPSVSEPPQTWHWLDSNKLLPALPPSNAACFLGLLQEEDMQRHQASAIGPNIRGLSLHIIVNLKLKIFPRFTCSPE